LLLGQIGGRGGEGGGGQEGKSEKPGHRMEGQSEKNRKTEAERKILSYKKQRYRERSKVEREKEANRKNRLQKGRPHRES
jgi:hypothetical protein